MNGNIIKLIDLCDQPLKCYQEKMRHVIKRSGNKDEFEPSKIRKSIKKAIIDSDDSSDRSPDRSEAISAEVIQAFEYEDEIQTSEIRKEILRSLDKNAKGAAESWRRFDSKYKIGWIPIYGIDRCTEKALFTGLILIRDVAGKMSGGYQCYIKTRKGTYGIRMRQMSFAL